MHKLTLGSLFDGSGGFPLGGILAGIEPKWASEIEPFPIKVTEKRLPQMKHYGDITTLNGAELPPVDIITFGSPCQDTSIAGKRNGLSGIRSGLFHEAIRIIKEMRCATNGRYPRFCVWENVPGAFSSNAGEDFRCVLEEICKIKEDSVSVPRPPNRWSKAGEVVADSFSVAYRVLDAAGWGVPQRRKRIYLVADFDGQCAGKILFESEGLSGYSAESFRAWQKSSGRAENCFGETSGRLNLNDQCGVNYVVYSTSKNSHHTVATENIASTLVATDYKDPPLVTVKARSFYPQTEYMVRRLVPQECARLQGFPDWWCSNLASDDPSDAEIDRWAEIFEAFRRATNPDSKPKSHNAIIRWLKNPHSDPAEYKMWGNGVALPCVYFVPSGIAYYADLETNCEPVVSKN